MEPTELEDSLRSWADHWDGHDHQTACVLRQAACELRRLRADVFQLRKDAEASDHSVDKLLTERDRLRDVNAKLVEALKRNIEDHQCAIKCDGPHHDCICWYCKAGTALAYAKENK